ncbi:MAG: HAD family hydrolase [Bacillota bacterium]
MRKRAVIFDFDGTLADTNNPEVVISLAQAQGHIVPEDLETRFNEHAGHYGPVFVERCFGISPEEARDLYHAWEVHDAGNPVQLYEKAEEMLLRLTEDYALCMLTSRHRTSLLPTLEHLGIENHFLHITAYEDTQHHKPDPRAFDGILETLAAHGITKEEIVFVGDTRTDLEAGIGAGIDTIIVETGAYHAQRATHPHDPRFILPSVVHLPSWLDAFHALEEAG